MLLVASPESPKIILSLNPSSPFNFTQDKTPSAPVQHILTIACPLKNQKQF